MIRVEGMVTLEVPYVFDINMTEEEWDNLSEGEQNNLIDKLIGPSEVESSTMAECDVWNVVEISDSES